MASVGIVAEEEFRPKREKEPNVRGGARGAFNILKSLIEREHDGTKRAVSQIETVRLKSIEYEIERQARKVGIAVPCREATSHI